MPATPATRALRRAGIDFTEHVYDHDPAVTDYGREAAAALGVPAARVFKTIVVAVADRGPRVVILPVDAMIDLKAVAAAAGGKRAALAPPADAERSTGYVLGGISPFGQRRPLPTLLDRSALTHDTILVSGGRRGFDVEVTPADLLRVLSADTAAIAR